jgi:hypothetical protein
MGGLVNDNFNLVRHSLVNQSEYVIRNWPGKLTISQFGHKTHTGAALKGTPKTNPVRDAYFRWFKQSFKGRSSWDQVAVLYGVRGLNLYFKENTRGKGRLSNGFEWPLKTGFRSCLDVKISNREMEKIIEELMIAPPGGQRRPEPRAKPHLRAGSNFLSVIDRILKRKNKTHSNQALQRIRLRRPAELRRYASAG